MTGTRLSYVISTLCPYDLVRHEFGISIIANYIIVPMKIASMNSEVSPVDGFKIIQCFADKIFKG